MAQSKHYKLTNNREGYGNTVYANLLFKASKEKS